MPVTENMPLAVPSVFIALKLPHLDHDLLTVLASPFYSVYHIAKVTKFHIITLARPVDKFQESTPPTSKAQNFATLGISMFKPFDPELTDDGQSLQGEESFENYQKTSHVLE